MNDARLAFQQLRSDAGAGYDARAIHASLDKVERRVERARIGRALVGAGAALAVIGVIAVVAPHIFNDDAVSPAATPSGTPSAPATSPSAEIVDELSLPCTVAGGIEGNPVGDLGGLEGWFNGTSTPPMCESKDEWTEWEHLAAAHPDTVLINTIDNTMIEAYYRTSRDALGVYATLSGDFKVPDPDPAWPAHSAVLIDAATGEVLSVSDFEEMDGFDSTAGEFEISNP